MNPSTCLERLKTNVTTLNLAFMGKGSAARSCGNVLWQTGVYKSLYVCIKANGLFYGTDTTSFVSWTYPKTCSWIFGLPLT